MRKLVLSIIGTSALSFIPAYSQVAIGLSPVPLWPQDGNVNLYPGQYVFLEPSTGSLVISVPASAESAVSFTGVPFRVRLPIAVAPQVTVSSQQGEDGRYVYTYAVANGPAASARITNWELEVASFQLMSVSAPAGWTAAPKVKTPGTESLYSYSPNHHCVWTTGSAGAGITPLLTTNGFKVSSPARPGFVLAHFQGGEMASEHPDQVLPGAVIEQLQPLLDVEYASVTVPVLGPKFSPTEAGGAVAGELHADISHLVNLHLVSDSSPFVAETLNTLKVYIQSAPSDGNITGLTGLRISAPPNGSIEQQIAQAVNQSLGIMITNR